MFGLLKKENKKNKLCTAIINEEIQTAEKLIKNGANLNILDEYGYSPLSRACQIGNFELFKLMLDYGADISLYSDDRNQLLIIALDENNLEIVEYLIKHGINGDVDQDTRAFEIACKKGYKEIAKILIDRNYIHYNMLSENLLCETIINDDIYTAHKLIDKGFDINCTTFHGATPLTLSEDIQFAKMLIEHGANVNNPKTNVSDALLEASQYGDINMVELLLEYGANVNSYDDQKLTPLERATDGGYTEVVELLLQHGAHVDLPNYFGDTPLEIALNNEYEDIVSLLVDYGATK